MNSGRFKCNAEVRNGWSYSNKINRFYGNRKAKPHMKHGDPVIKSNHGKTDGIIGVSVLSLRQHGDVQGGHG